MQDGPVSRPAESVGGTTRNPFSGRADVAPNGRPGAPTVGIIRRLAPEEGISGGDLN